MPHPPPYGLPRYMVGECEFERTKAVVRLELRLAQGCFAVAALNSDEHLPPMTRR